jgi:hypothetical protein
MYRKTFQSVLFGLLLLAWGCSPNNEIDSETDDNDSTGLVLGIDTSLQAGFKRIRFVASNEIIRNPERGFFNHLEWTNAGGAPVSSGALQNLKNQHLSLVANIYYMTDYVDKPLDEAMLSLIKANLKSVRDNGFKAILRFAYSKSQSALVYDAPIEICLEHIDQLKPILHEYVDVIAVMEAGFIGVWGEWYYTNHYGSGAFFKTEMRNQLLDAILSALPRERMVCLRTPGYKAKLLGITLTDTLTPSEAYNQTKKARLALHNDCFVASDNDMGTFFSEAERTYSQADSRYVAMGGETCAPSAYSECLNSMQQLHDYHWSYLNKDYHQTVLNNWAINGCMDEIKKKLGYRFELIYADASTSVQKGSDYALKCLIKNSGYAAPYNPRNVYLLLLSKNGDEVQRIRLNKIDPRFWMSDAYQLIELSLPIPNGIPAGEYTVALHLPDPQAGLAGVPDYAIRLANEQVWNEQKGYNALFSIDIP